MYPSRRAVCAYVAPFAAFVGIMALERVTNLPPEILYPARFVTTLLLVLLVSRPYLSLRTVAPWASVVIGIAVFLVWIAPDRLFHYRHFWLFENSITGAAVPSIPSELRRSLAFIMMRTASCALLVPVVEELFWRGFLLRWLADRNWIKAPFTYVPAVFWTATLLFASEHGPYWEVGLIAGIVYNWWILRTRNLADCILAHAVTNGLLSAYVLVTGEWQYWL
jgi:CAAX prenyl protease-like protein